MMLPFNKNFSANIAVFTSDRTVDFAFNDRQNSFNDNQKEFLSAQLNSKAVEPVHIRQVHGGRVIVADQNFPEKGLALEEADGLITKAPQLPIAIRSADCLPVFLFDEKQEGIGLIHVGWRGCQKNIIGKAVKLMEKEWRSNPRDIKVSFGPGIRCCCYEVGNEFQEYFPEELISRNGRYYLDLPKVNYGQLTECGIERKNIFDCGICTCCDKNYFSNRRDGKKAGRMISLIMLRKKPLLNEGIEKE